MFTIDYLFVLSMGEFALLVFVLRLHLEVFGGFFVPLSGWLWIVFDYGYWLAFWFCLNVVSLAFDICYVCFVLFCLEMLCWKRLLVDLGFDFSVGVDLFWLFCLIGLGCLVCLMHVCCLMVCWCELIVVSGLFAFVDVCFGVFAFCCLVDWFVFDCVV